LIASLSEGRWRLVAARVIVVRTISYLDNVQIDIVVARRHWKRRFFL
jgi:hypothetical protein